MKKGMNQQLWQIGNNKWPVPHKHVVITTKVITCITLYVSGWTDKSIQNLYKWYCREYCNNSYSQGLLQESSLASYTKHVPTKTTHI